MMDAIVDKITKRANKCSSRRNRDGTYVWL